MRIHLVCLPLYAKSLVGMYEPVKVVVTYDKKASSVIWLMVDEVEVKKKPLITLIIVGKPVSI